MVVIWDKSLRELQWEVVSTKSNKTIVVQVERIKEHPLYRKRYGVSKKFYAHDEENTANEWDIVLIRETKPISKKKRWKLIKIVDATEIIE